MQNLLTFLKRIGDEMPLPFTVAELEKPDRPLAYVNPIFSEQTGYMSDEIVGRNCRFLQGEGTSNEVTRQIRESIDQRRTGYFDILNFTKNGLPFGNRLILFPVGYSEERYLYYVGIQNVLDRSEEVLARFKQSVPGHEITSRIRNPILSVLNKMIGMEMFSFVEPPEKTEVIADEIRKEIQSIVDYVLKID